jgi:hypothetical protein
MFSENRVINICTEISLKSIAHIPTHAIYRLETHKKQHQIDEHAASVFEKTAAFCVNEA